MTSFYEISQAKDEKRIAEAKVVKDYIRDANIIAAIPKYIEDIVNHEIKYKRIESGSTDTGRPENASHTASSTINRSPVTRQLVTRYYMFEIDRKWEDEPAGQSIINDEISIGLSALGNSANERLINGDKALDVTTYDGFNQIALNAGLSSAYGTNVTTQATALTFFEYIEDAISGLRDKATHIIVGKLGREILLRAASYTQQVMVNPESASIGRFVGSLITSVGTLPIVYAGLKSDGNQVIGGSSTTDIYLVNFGEDGLQFAFEDKQIEPQKTTSKVQYVMEQYQTLVDFSKYSVFKHTQTVA